MADLNRMAHRIVREASKPESDDPATPAEVSGRNGEHRGGAAPAAKLTPERRSEIARKAARAPRQKAR